MRGPVKPATAEGRRHGRPRDAVVRPVGPRAARHPARHAEGARAQGQASASTSSTGAATSRGATRTGAGRSERDVRRSRGRTPIHCVRGGWGAARLLPLLDWDTIARNPKILVGYSDITALLLSLHAQDRAWSPSTARSGHPTWNAFNLDWMKRVLWNGEAATFANAKEASDTLVPVKNRTRVITPGKARGRLLGGNLTVLHHHHRVGLPARLQGLHPLPRGRRGSSLQPRPHVHAAEAGRHSRPGEGRRLGHVRQVQPGRRVRLADDSRRPRRPRQAARRARVLGRDDWPRRPPVHAAARRPGRARRRRRLDHHARERGRLTSGGESRTARPFVP
ncbi:MAG: LD-carboxypeptidase [Comamonadaceae bacterium]|nr:LD-carboxypeptidase [Comamonadaceae bacterium]